MVLVVVKRTVVRVELMENRGGVEGSVNMNNLIFCSLCFF